MHKPTVICHADWSTSPDKRWCARAILGREGKYTAYAPEKVERPDLLLGKLRAEVGDAGCVFAGFDFPIGLPAQYADRAEITSFRPFLTDLTNNAKWNDFFSVCDSPEQISMYRPFYPNGEYKGRRKEHLIRAHGVSSVEPLLRRCERGGDGVKQACCLFWTLGGNQVGKAALCGWREVLIPALENGDHARLWPFDGALQTLFAPGNTIIAETYPAECYGWFSTKPLRNKTDLDCRKKFGVTLLSWARQNSVIIDSRLEKDLSSGFPVGEDDAFDAVVGLLGMLAVGLGKRGSGEPADESVSKVEGWILGRNASTDETEQTSAPSPQWSEWRLFPDPRRCDILVAPFGPGCYDLRDRRTHDSVLCGTGDHLPQRMSSLLPPPYGCGTRNNAAKREYVLAHLGDIEYRTIATATKAEALEIESRLLRDRRYMFPT